MAYKMYKFFIWLMFNIFQDILETAVYAYNVQLCKYKQTLTEVFSKRFAIF